MQDYTEKEISAVQKVLAERYKEEIEIFLADCEIQPDKDKSKLVECPAIFWRARDCNFVVVKLAPNRFRGHFFYRPDEHFGGEVPEYTDAVNCTRTLLQFQSDHEREQQGVTSGSTGADLE